MHVSDLAAQAHTPADGNDVRGREKATVCGIGNAWGMK